MAKKTEQIVEIEGKKLKLSNLDKVLYPAVGFTKGQVIDYFVRIAPVLLPHLKDRPLTMKRYPEGVDGQFFYEKNCPKHRPDWVQTAKVWSYGRSDYMQYCLAQDLPTLVWAANLADLELHTSLSRAEKIEQPTMMVFDLDPGPPADIVLCCQIGFWLKEIFDRFNLKAFPKTSGSKGLQIYVPLNTSVTYDQTKGFSRALARLLEQQHPDLVVSDMKKALRTGKVFVDWSQNDEHKTTINVYSLRAKERPTVSTPASWEEVEQCLKKKDAKLLVFESSDVLARVQEMGDLFAEVQTLRQHLPNITELGEESTPKSNGRSSSAAKEPKAKKSPAKKAAPKAERSSGEKVRIEQAG
jgi:bifunctional non-homologous end joining protein LigD